MSSSLQPNDRKAIVAFTKGKRTSKKVMQALERLELVGCDVRDGKPHWHLTSGGRVVVDLLSEIEELNKALPNVEPPEPETVVEIEIDDWTTLIDTD